MTESESKELPPITVHEDIIKQFSEGGLAAVFAFLGKAMHDDAGRRTANKNPAWAEVPKGSLLSLSALFDSLSLMLPGATFKATVLPTGQVSYLCGGCDTPVEVSGVTRCPNCSPVEPTPGGVQSRTIGTVPEFGEITMRWVRDFDTPTILHGKDGTVLIERNEFNAFLMSIESESTLDGELMKIYISAIRHATEEGVGSGPLTYTSGSLPTLTLVVKLTTEPAGEDDHSFTYTPSGFAELLHDPVPWAEPMAPQGAQAAVEIAEGDPPKA